MADIKFLLDHFQREWHTVLNGRLNPGQGIGSNELEVGHLVVPIAESSVGSMAMFAYDDKYLRLTLGEGQQLPEFVPDVLYFVSAYDKTENVVTVSSLRICPMNQWASLEICFDDEYVIKRSKKRLVDPAKLAKDLTEGYIFKYGRKFLIFRKTYPNNNDFEMYGTMGYTTNVVYREGKGKYFISKDRSQGFPQDYQMFIERVECLCLDSATVCEESAAKAAHQEILSRIQTGTALIKIWNTYSEIEQARAIKLKDSIGVIPYKVLLSTPDVTCVQCDISDENREALYASRDDLKNASMEVYADTFNMAESKPLSFKIKDIDLDSRRIYFYDEDNMMPENGFMEVSTKGDETVKTRRDFAVRKLQDAPDVLMRSILLAMEDKADALLAKSRRAPIKTVITERTRKFLKEKFGIENLTQNQLDAVRIALNTPDMALIQGPPGTGKSTVIAAICHRLIEEAEKKHKTANDKVILVSAFQNDTVEHIASKIDTLGLPTIKAGKETQGNIRAEYEMIESMKKKIDDAIHHLPPEKDLQRVSRVLMDERELLCSKKDYQASKARIQRIVNGHKDRLSDELWKQWQAISPSPRVVGDEKPLKAIKGLLCTPQTYSDGGYERIARLLYIGGLDFTESEIELLENAPFSDEEPTEEFLMALTALKEKYLGIIYSSRNETDGCVQEDLVLWLDMAIRYFNELEQAAYEDEEVFLISVLRSLREDLELNARGVRDAIKQYGESLAATNQVAGGKELFIYKNIQNVVLEEAARSNPLDLLIPMTKATDRVILVGDQKQLPHLLENDIVDDAVAAIDDQTKKGEIERKYQESLFNIFYNSLKKVKVPARCIMLKEQFRMHPAIGDFISRLYYDGELVPGMGWEKQAEAKRHGLQLPWAKDKVAVFCDVPASCGREHSGKSKYRRAEAKRIFGLLDEMKKDPAFENLSVGIITFYSKQVDILFEEAVKHGYAELNKDGSYSMAPDYLKTGDGDEKLRIGTVDSFQGKEFDVVILSTVRSNEIERTDENYLKVYGFLTLFNRLNVAFSRAKKMIVVAGDAEMFEDEYAKSHTEGLYEFFTSFSKDEKYGTRIR